MRGDRVGRAAWTAKNGVPLVGAVVRGSVVQVVGSCVGVIRLGERMFSPNGGLTRAIAEDILITGSEMAQEKITALSTHGDLDLLADNRAVLLLAQEHCVTFLNVHGTCFNGGLATEFGKQPGVSLRYSAPTLREGWFSHFGGSNEP